MTSDELQEVIDDIDEAVVYLTYLEDDSRMLRSLKIASDILVRFPDEVLATYKPKESA